MARKSKCIRPSSVDWMPSEFIRQSLSPSTNHFGVIHFSSYNYLIVRETKPVDERRAQELFASGDARTSLCATTTFNMYICIYIYIYMYIYIYIYICTYTYVVK